MPGNRIVAEAGAKDARSRVETYLRKVVGDESPEPRWQTHLDYAAKAVDAILAHTDLKLIHMEEYADYFSDEPGGSSAGRSVEPAPFDLNKLGRHRNRIQSVGIAAPIPMPITGADFRWMNLMLKRPDKAGWRIARRVAQGVGGKVLGKDYAAGGQGLAAGGFDRDMDKRHEYQCEAIEPCWQFGAKGNVGDTIDLAKKHGLDLTLLDKAWCFPGLKNPDPAGPPMFALAERTLPGTLIVDGSGHRFFNEATDYMRAGETILGLDDGEPPHLPAWLIFDKKFVKSYVMGGVKMPLMGISKEWFEAGVAVEADTIEELGRKIGVDDLPGGVARFNVLAAQGQDDDFGRGKTAYDRYYGDPTNTPNPNLRPRLAPTWVFTFPVGPMRWLSGL